MGSALPVASTLALLACAASPGQLGTYEPQQRASDAPPERAYTAALALANDRGWKLIDDDANLRRFVAVGPVDSSYGMTTRERWIVSVEVGTVVVEHYTEVRDDRLRWDIGYAIPHGYTYAREQNVLDEIGVRCQPPGDAAMKPHSKNASALTTQNQGAVDE